MVVSALFSVRAIFPCCVLLLGVTGWSQALPENLPKPPPLPPGLQNRQLTPPPNLPDPSELQSQLKQLGDLLNMDPEKLGKLRQTIEFIENMSTAEREAMRIRISQITQSTPELSREIQDLSVRFPSVVRSDLSQFWLAASKNERDSVRDSLEQLEQEQQVDFIESKVRAFVEIRDAAFEEMRASLESKRKSLPQPPVTDP